MRYWTSGFHKPWSYLESVVKMLINKFQSLFVIITSKNSSRAWILSIDNLNLESNECILSCELSIEFSLSKNILAKFWEDYKLKSDLNILSVECHRSRHWVWLTPSASPSSTAWPLRSLQVGIGFLHSHTFALKENEITTDVEKLDKLSTFYRLYCNIIIE